MITVGAIEMGFDSCSTDPWVIWSSRGGGLPLVNTGSAGPKYDAGVNTSYDWDGAQLYTQYAGSSIATALSEVECFGVTGMTVAATFYWRTSPNANGILVGIYSDTDPYIQLIAQPNIVSLPTYGIFQIQSSLGQHVKGTVTSPSAFNVGRNDVLMFAPGTNGGTPIAYLNGSPFPNITVTEIGLLGSDMVVGGEPSVVYGNSFDVYGGGASGMAIYHGPIKPGDLEYWASYVW